MIRKPSFLEKWAQRSARFRARVVAGVISAAILAAAIQFVPDPDKQPLPPEQFSLTALRLSPDRPARLSLDETVRLEYHRKPEGQQSLRYANCHSSRRSLGRDVMVDPFFFIPDHWFPCWKTEVVRFEPLVREVSPAISAENVVTLSAEAAFQHEGHRYSLARIKIRGRLCEGQRCVSGEVDADFACQPDGRPAAMTGLGVLRYTPSNPLRLRRCGLQNYDLGEDRAQTLAWLRAGKTYTHYKPLNQLPAFPVASGPWIRNALYDRIACYGTRPTPSFVAKGTDIGLGDTNLYEVYGHHKGGRICDIRIRHNGGHEAPTACYPAARAFSGVFRYTEEGLLHFEPDRLPDNRRFELTFDKATLVETYELRSASLDVRGNWQYDLHLWSAQAEQLLPQIMTPPANKADLSCYEKVGQTLKQRMARAMKNS